MQVAEEEQNLWDEYATLAEDTKTFAIRKVTEASQIYPVFRDLFKKVSTELIHEGDMFAVPPRHADDRQQGRAASVSVTGRS